MKLKSIEKVKYKKNLNKKFNITFIEYYKQSHNKSILKILSKVEMKRENILLGILRRRQGFNEIITIKAVENCRRRVFEEIEKYFDQKERNINSLITDSKSYSNIFENDVLEIYRNTENIIMDELFKRFKRLIVWQFQKANSGDWISNIFSSIQKYQKTKRQTVLITSYMEALGSRTINNSIESLIKNPLIDKLVCDIDISTIILSKLGINSDLESKDLNEELLNRIVGALYSIKVGLVQDLNNQIANIFYETHDILLNSKFKLKINSIEDKIAREEICEIDLLEA